MRSLAGFALIGWLALFAATAAGDVPDFTRLMRDEGRAVVNISSIQMIRGAAEAFAGAMPEDTSRDRDLRPDAGEAEDFEVRSLGSGFLISADGYVVTSAHVTSGPGRHEIVVRLADRREFAARVVGADYLTDIALLKIDAAGLPQVRVGNPAQLQPGEWVAAVGSPFGFERSITAGIVSAMGRMLPDGSYVPFIQTDVAVNPGNSGGPLFNLRGEVIGVNSLIFSRSGGYMGLSFAVPMDYAMEVVEQLRARGSVTRGRIGVRLQEVTAELGKALRLPQASGALVVDAEKGGAAERAGLRAGDVIVRFDGRPVETDVDLVRMTARARPGDVIEVELSRRGVPLRLRVRIDSARGTAPAAVGSLTAPLEPAAQGLQLVPLTREQRERLEIEGGLLVKHADENAQRAGLQSGDVILSANGEPAGSVSRFRALLQASAQAGLALLVQRAGARLFVALREGG